MNPESGENRSTRVSGREAGSLILVIGLGLGVVHVVHAFRVMDPLSMVMGVVIPVGFAAGLVGAGVWIRRSHRADTLLVRMAAWAIIGALWMGIVGVGATSYQLLEGGTVRDPFFFLSVFVTYGTLPGLLVGWYDGRQRVQTRRLAERDESLRDTNEQLNLVLDAANLGFWDWDLQTDEVTFGGQYASLLGLSEDELGNSPDTWEERIHPEDLPSVNQTIHDHFQGGSDFYQTTHRKRMADGEWRWIRDVGKVVERDEDGEPLRAIGINEDINQLKERERELQETKERLDLALEGANLGVWDWDMQSDEVSRDERWAAMLGYREGVVEAHIDGWEDLVHPEDRDRHDEALQDHIDGEKEYYTCDYRLKAKSGDWKWVRNIGKIFERDEDGKPIRSVGIHQDIDDRKRTYQQLEERTEQLEALNRVVRHDIRNDMNVIYGWASQLEGHVDEAGHKALENVLSVSTHVIELTEVAREFVESLGNGERLELEPTDLRGHLENEIDARRQSYPEAEFTLSADSDDIRVLANEMLSSVFRNLLVNAVQHNDTDTPEVVVDVTTDGESVRVDIADNGPGVPDERKETIFGRSEKGLESSGTGIGLYLVDTLVDGYGGEVRVADNDPRGAVFSVELPLAD